MRSFVELLLGAGAVVLTAVVITAQQPADGGFASVLAEEELVRRRLTEAPSTETRAEDMAALRAVVASYERIADAAPRSAYGDNALWQGAVLASDTFLRFGDAADRATALRLFDTLGSRYPSSSLLRRAEPHLVRLRQGSAAPAGAAREPPRRNPATPSAAAPVPASAVEPRAPLPVPEAPPEPSRRLRGSSPSVLRTIRREALPETLRVTLELERETSYSDGSLDGPPRLFIDLQNTTVVAPLKNASLAFSDDVVRQIRIGHHPGSRTRVVLDLSQGARHSIYPLYEPYRLVIDIQRARAGASGAVTGRGAAPPAPPRPASPVTAPVDVTLPARPLAVIPSAAPGVGSARISTTVPRATTATVPARSTAGPSAESPRLESPAAPAANAQGGFSLSRQLGLGIARVVVDPGHGGRDPGAQAGGLTEADLVLDIALRLEKVLMLEPGVEVVLTRRADSYLSLEDRTAVANRERGDLFLSIHANASANSRAVGIETYFLNFAPNPEAEALAARENADSARTMRELSDLVRAITTNNKRDESRDFAATVQTAMIGGLKRVNRDLRNLGVKQAPFQVLVGATMPGLLTEVGFLTHKQEGALLRTERYRQQIAETLATGVLAYQRSLKVSKTVASK